MLGLETALGVCLAHLDLPVAEVVAALSWKPAAIAGVADVHGRPVAVGEPANLTVFDPTHEWEVMPAKLASKSRNTPYVGVRCGVVCATRCWRARSWCSIRRRRSE